MTVADPLVMTLARIVVELSWLLDEWMDENGEPRDALKTLEWISYILGELDADQRKRLVEVVKQLAAETEAGPQREFIESFPEAMGLIDDDE